MENITDITTSSKGGGSKDSEEKITTRRELNLIDG